jgi:cytochrome bd-type quinol oxidase subunit 1
MDNLTAARATMGFSLGFHIIFAAIGMPFSWEGTAFFLEAIAIGLLLYGWNRMKPWMH